MYNISCFSCRHHDKIIQPSLINVLKSFEKVLQIMDNNDFKSFSSNFCNSPQHCREETLALSFRYVDWFNNSRIILKWFCDSVSWILARNCWTGTMVPAIRRISAETWINGRVQLWGRCYQNTRSKLCQDIMDSNLNLTSQMVWYKTRIPNFSDAPYIVRGVSTYQDVCVWVRSLE